MEKKLRSCPFCGNWSHSELIAVISRDKEGVVTGYISCQICGGAGPQAPVNSIEASWNKRSSEEYL